MNVFAHTENCSRPAYISVNQSSPDVVKVSVRSRDTDVASEAHLTKAGAVELASKLLAWAGEAPKPDVRGMANRFCGWKLPQDFSPDAGISFIPSSHPFGWPTGTNVLSHTQALAMFEHCVGGTKP